MKTYNYLLFDWDGCLTKTLDLTIGSYKTIFAKYGVDTDYKTIVEKVLGDWNGPLKLGIKDKDAFTKDLLSEVEKTYSKCGLYDVVSKTLHTLSKNGKKMAMITTSPKSLVWPSIEQNNLQNIFDLYLMADDVKKHKPDPEIVYKSINKMGGDKTEYIIIGDFKTDLGAGLNAGIDSILFYPKENEKFFDLKMLKKYKPTYIVRKFEEILGIVK